MARSTAITKAREAAASARKSASRARAQVKEQKGVKGAVSATPATVTGGALCGVANGAGARSVVGAPSDILISVALGVGGAATGFAPAVHAANGAAAVAVARYTEQGVVGLMKPKKAKKSEEDSE